MIVQKVNHRNIYDIVQHDDEDSVENDVFQEDDSSELPSFHPTEEVVDTSSLVREDVDPVSLPHEEVTEIRTAELNLNDHEVDDIDDYYNDGRLFVHEEPILESEADDNTDDDSDLDIDDDF